MHVSDSVQRLLQDERDPFNTRLELLNVILEIPTCAEREYKVYRRDCNERIYELNKVSCNKSLKHSF